MSARHGPGAGRSAVGLRLFDRVLRLDRWMRARFTPLGRMLVAAFIGVGLFALNPRATLAYQLAIALLAVILAATLWAPLFRPRLAVRRTLPRHVTAGTPFRYTLELRNTGARRLEDLAVEDELRRVAPARAGAEAAQDLPPRRGWRRPRVGYMLFKRAVRRLEGGRCLASALRELGPGRGARVPVEVVPIRRGWLHLDAVRVTHADPLGVFRAVARVPAADRVLVLPARYPVRWDGAGAAVHRPRPGRTRSRVTGPGTDFARLREYRPRDPLRHIHWRAWARLGEPVVKEFHEESPSRNALVLDTFAPTGCTRAIFEEAVSVAASFVADPGWRSGRLDLLFAGRDTVHLAQGHEGEGVSRMLEALAGVARTDPAGFELLAESVRRRSGDFTACVLVLLALDEARRALVRWLEARGVSVLVLVVADDAHERIGDSRAAPRDARTLRAVAPGEAARVLASLAAGGLATRPGAAGA